MAETRTSAADIRPLDYSIEYLRVSGWRVSCGCGEFTATRNSFDSGMFYELSKHIRDAHEGHDPDGLVLSPFDMLAFVEYFDDLSEKSISNKQWTIGLAVLVILGMIPIVWNIVDRVLLLTNP